MNYLSDFTVYNELLENNRTWKLLRADTAPFILAFLKNIFKDEQEIDYEEARTRLKDFLQDLKEECLLNNDRNATDYLRDWLDHGWLVELNNKLSMTDAAQKALDFCNMLNKQSISTSATHLQILQNEVQKLFVRVGTDKKARIGELKQQRNILDLEIKMIEEGREVALTENEKRERIRAIYDIANNIPKDFRKLEEESREIDRNIRIKMIETGYTKGRILSEVLKEQRDQRLTEYGAAYEGFFELLTDEKMRSSFTNQMQFILSQPIAKYLTKEQHNFLARFINVLIKECDRIIKVRSKIDSNLSLYIQSEDYQENHIISKLLSKLERIAVNFKNSDINMSSELVDVTIESGVVKTFSIIDTMNFIQPKESTDYSDIENNQNQSQLSNDVIKQLDTVRVSQVRSNIEKTLGKTSIMSVAEIIRNNKILYGLPEVVTYVRLAHELNAEYKNDEKDEIIVDDHKRPGKKICITIPRQILSSQNLRDIKK